jgi:stage II sporulation protein D
MRKIIVSVRLSDILITIVIVFGFIILLTFVLGVNKGENKSEKNIKYIDSKPNAMKNSTQQNYIKQYNYLANSEVNIYLTKEDRIVAINIEDYIMGVVAAEMPANFEVEALKAQAVAARTYALAHMKDMGGNRCSKGKGAELCDSVHCQVYMKKKDRMRLWPQSKGEKYWSKIVNAVKDTYGQVLIYDGELVMNPYYFATSSGKTENAHEVFANGQSYLKSVNSPGEESAPKYKSNLIYSYSELWNILNKEYPDMKIGLNDLKSKVKILKRSEGGSVIEIKVGEVILSGMEFRFALGLNSANFKINFNDDNIEISCKGYGHGVGMSQWGANAMAKKGKNYNDILKHYYQGVEIEKINYK